MAVHPTLAKLHALLIGPLAEIGADDMAAHSAGQWSAAEILEHLNLTYTGTIKNLERCLRGERQASPDRGKRRWARIVVTRLGFMPSGREAPKAVRPRGMPAEQVKAEIMANLARMDELISQSEARSPHGKPIADHPILGPLTAAEWRRFHLAHGKHHVRQVRARRREAALLRH